MSQALPRRGHVARPGAADVLHGRRGGRLAALPLQRLHQFSRGLSRPGHRCGRAAVSLLPGSHPPAARKNCAAFTRARHPACARREPRAGVPAMGGHAGHFGDGKP